MVNLSSFLSFTPKSLGDQDIHYIQWKAIRRRAVWFIRGLEMDPLRSQSYSVLAKAGLGKQLYLRPTHPMSYQHQRCSACFHSSALSWAHPMPVQGCCCPDESLPGSLTEIVQRHLQLLTHALVPGLKHFHFISKVSLITRRLGKANKP